MTGVGSLDLARYIKAGDGIWWSQTSAEPTPLVHALLDQVDRIGPVRAFVGMTWNTRLTTELPENLSVVSYGALGELRALSKAGLLEVIPCNYSALPRLFAQGALPHDVGLVQVSPPDADGLCSLGVGVDYIADALDHTRVLIAEVNHQMPSTIGSTKIPSPALPRRWKPTGHSWPSSPRPRARPNQLSPRSLPAWSKTATRCSSVSVRCPPPFLRDCRSGTTSASTRA